MKIIQLFYNHLIKCYALKDVFPEKLSWPLAWKTATIKKFNRFSFFMMEPNAKSPRKDFLEVLEDRRSTRTPTGVCTKEIIDSIFLNAVCYNNVYKRPYPSAGGLYPIDLYIFVAKDLGVLKKGVYYIDPHGKYIDLNIKDTFSHFFAYDFSQSATVIGVQVARVYDSYVKYEEKSYNFALLEAGASLQNIYLLATLWGVSCTALGGFDIKKISDILDIDYNYEMTVNAFCLL